MATFPYMAFTDGTTTITLIAGTSAVPGNYTLVKRSWALAMPGRRVDLLGGQGPYQDAIEEMEINVTGASVTAMYANLAALVALLDQADRWAAGDNVAAVRWQYIPLGSSRAVSDPYEAVVLERARDDILTLPPTTVQDSVQVYTASIRLAFRRRHPLVNETDNVSISTAASNAVRSTAAFPAHTGLSPVRAVWSPLPITAYGGELYEAQVVLAHARPGNIIVHNLATSTTAEGNQAVNSDVRRASAALDIFTETITPLPAGTRAAAIYITARPNTAGNSWQVTGWLENSALGALLDPRQTRPRVITESVVGPRVYSLGVVALPEATGTYNRLSLVIERLVGAGTLDIDVVMLVALDDVTRIVETTVRNNNANTTIDIDPRVVTSYGPLVRDSGISGGTLIYPANGDAYVLQTGTGLDVCALGTVYWQSGSPPSYAGLWRLGRADTGALTNIGVALTRRRAYLVPQ